MDCSMLLMATVVPRQLSHSNHVQCLHCLVPSRASSAAHDYTKAFIYVRPSTLQDDLETCPSESRKLFTHIIPTSMAGGK